MAAHRAEEPIYVTRPSLPPLEAYAERLETAWSARWLTNRGALHEELEAKLAKRLDAPYLSLFCNGTIALLTALKAADIHDGEIITTPFTFPATVHALHWNGVRPVFADIDPATSNLDPAAVERLITPATRAILAVHVYGQPCDVDAFDSIAKRHGLVVMYDAAHTFGVALRGKPAAAYGDYSVLSFHATKLYTTGEGGALISQSAAQHERIGFLRNFGIANEEEVIGAGINGKMSEFHAALGLLQLETVDQEIASRRAISKRYRELLSGIPGITLHAIGEDVYHNGAYFPIRIDAGLYGLDRNQLYDALKPFNIHTRKYFYPLCSHYPGYCELPSAAPACLPVAERVAEEILCLPIFGSLEMDRVESICTLLRALPKAIA